jgi:hypothetical protein
MGNHGRRAKGLRDYRQAHAVEQNQAIAQDNLPAMARASIDPPGDTTENNGRTSGGLADGARTAAKILIP